MEYSARHEKYPNKIIISYPLQWGRSQADRGLWLAELNGEVWDYNPKELLINDAISRGFDYIVLRVHRSGLASPQPNKALNSTS